jgi:hypothetical protein
MGVSRFNLDLASVGDVHDRKSGTCSKLLFDDCITD